MAGMDLIAGVTKEQEKPSEEEESEIHTRSLNLQVYGVRSTLCPFLPCHDKGEWIGLAELSRK